MGKIKGEEKEEGSKCLTETRLIKMPVILEVAAKTCFPCCRVNTPFKVNQLFLTLSLGSPFSLCWEGMCPESQFSQNYLPCRPFFNKESQKIGQEVGHPNWVIHKPPLLVPGDEQGGEKSVSSIAGGKTEPNRCLALPAMRACTPWLRKVCCHTDTESPVVSRMVSQDAERSLPESTGILVELVA